MHNPPISDAFVNKEYVFLYYANDSTLTFIDIEPVSCQ